MIDLQDESERPPSAPVPTQKREAIEEALRRFGMM